MSTGIAAANPAVTVRGDGDVVVLMLHGLGGDKNQPLGLLDEATNPAFTIVAPDQRAHGEATVIGTPDDFTLDALANDATTLLTTLGLAERPVVLVGISMGAAVALRVAQRGTLDVRGALLIRPAFERKPWPAHLQVFRRIAALLRSDGASGLASFVDSLEYQTIADVSPACAKSLREQFTKPLAPERVVRLETVPGCASITWNNEWTPPCPVTVVGAQDDPVHPWTTAQLWQQSIATADLVDVGSRDRAPEQYQRALADVTRDRLARWAR